jgi:hypothetical protein
MLFSLSLAIRALRPILDMEQSSSGKKYLIRPEGGVRGILDQL